MCGSVGKVFNLDGRQQAAVVSRNIVNLPPKYTEAELLSILNTDPQLPCNITEQDFFSDIRGNKKIKWRVNHFLLKRKLLLSLLDVETFRKWKSFKSLNWLIALTLIGFTIWTKDYKILLFLLVYPYLIISVDHWIFIFNMVMLIAIKLFFDLNIFYFWFFLTTILIGYVLNKATNEMIERKILQKALGDWITFWKYYSNKIIWMDKTALNNEYQRLTEKYSELRK